MGHLAGKDIYRQLGTKIDGMMFSAPQKDVFYDILRLLYTDEEAEVVIKMPYALATIERIAASTGYDQAKLQHILDRLTTKGLVIDIFVNNAYHYTPSPIVVGIFEFTMMRTAVDLDTKKMATLFHEYMQGDDAFYARNFGNHQQVSVMRSLPHQEAIKDAEYVEILDYEKAAAIVDMVDTYAIGICSCRHKKLHLDEKHCDTSLDNCLSLGIAADYLIRHHFARKVSKTEILESLTRSKEQGLVLNSDNVRRNHRFICQCCKCCCSTLQGISKFGYANTIVTSTFIAEVDDAACIGCGKCAKACPIEAISMTPINNPQTKKKMDARIDEKICLGCGVCALKCKTGALGLVKRKQRVIHPEGIFERIVLQSLERGTLQNQMFDDPGKISHQAMRAILGAFFKLTPVHRALMSDTLRSTFLKSMEMGLAVQGKGWLAKL
ncbi:MAG: 4Fe-4S binding protein [Desulfosalsimonadaceae bacterium]|nr:4Fe-4S binding protein [Desulfosalsimonadaceae bacterium]